MNVAYEKYVQLSMRRHSNEIHHTCKLPSNSVAMIAMKGGGFEVAKMTVAEAARGTGLGRLLMQACLDEAARAGAPRLSLESNSSLAPALGLYRAMGFRDLAPMETPYARADVFMERPY